MDFLEISSSSSFQTLKLYANKLNCCFLPCAAQFKLSNMKKSSHLAVDVDCLNLVDDKMTGDV